MLGVCALGVAAVSVDRLFLLPASADAAPVVANAASVSEPAGEAVPTLEDLSPIPGPPETAGLRGAIDRLAQERGIERSSIRASLFRVSEASGPPAVDPADTANGDESVRWPDIRLSAVVLSESGAAAVLNGRVVPIGASILGAQLVDVRPDQVTMRSRGRTRTLELPRPIWLGDETTAPWSGNARDGAVRAPN